jgi:ADP-heptose:LPS heptosyltransferase
VTTHSDSIDPSRVERVALFRALFLGDLLLSVPAFRAIRSRFPTAEITLISLPWAQEFATHMRPYIDRFEPFTGYPGFLEAGGTPKSVAAFLSRQRAQRYDVAVQMHGSGSTSNPFILQLGARVTAGLYAFRPPEGMTLAAPYPEDQPEICRNLRLAAMLGANDLDPSLEFPLLLEDRREAYHLLGRVLESDAPLVVLHPGSSSRARRWPVERFAALGDLLAERLGAAIAVTGGTGERPLVREVVTAMKAPALDLAGRTTLGGLAAVLSHAMLVVANDTGPSHLAEAVGTRTVTIHGPADITRWAPLDRTRFPIVRVPVACSPCEYVDCPIDHRCMTSITPARVLATIDALLQREGIPCDA